MLRWLAIVLLLATALIHIAIGLTGPAGVLFVAIDAIYLIGVGALAANIRPRLFQTLSIAYTVLLILAWAAATAASPPEMQSSLLLTPIALIDKAIELILVGTLVALHRQTPIQEIRIGKSVVA